MTRVLRIAELTPAGSRWYLTGWTRTTTGFWRLEFEMEFTHRASARTVRRRFLNGERVI